MESCSVTVKRSHQDRSRTSQNQASIARFLLCEHQDQSDLGRKGLSQLIFSGHSPLPKKAGRQFKAGPDAEAMNEG